MPENTNEFNVAGIEGKYQIGQRSQEPASTWIGDTVEGKPDGF